MNPPVRTHPKNTTSTAAPPPPSTIDSDFVVILAALLCALICVVGLVAVARCAWTRRRPSASVGQLRANKGLKKKTLRSLPKLTYAGAGATGEMTECAICLTEFAEGDEIRVLPQCGHGFHVGCVDTWLGSHSSCPSCRCVLVSRCKNCHTSADVEAGLKAREDGAADLHRDQSSNPQSEMRDRD
ncbi:hypothetical protein Scep_019923 [Stephania cephalantha]|uniref:RING-type E3 ubiquitin transferase n=1 Tax=Stephania cephalantha TaxID=152367 RepID=A0AAP0NNG0_9MAGN